MKRPLYIYDDTLDYPGCCWKYFGSSKVLLIYQRTAYCIDRRRWAVRISLIDKVSFLDCKLSANVLTLLLWSDHFTIYDDTLDSRMLLSLSIAFMKRHTTLPLRWHPGLGTCGTSVVRSLSACRWVVRIRRRGFPLPLYHLRRRRHPGSSGVSLRSTLDYPRYFLYQRC